MSMSKIAKYVLAGALSLVPYVNDSRVMTAEDISKISLEQKNSWPSVYDTIENKFFDWEDGIHDEFLNNNMCAMYKLPEYLAYFKRADSLENIGEWHPITYPSRLLHFSTLLTRHTAIHNFKVLSAIDTIPITRLDSSLIPLKKLMTSLDSIYSKDISSFSKLRKMYTSLAKKICAGEKTLNSLPIELLVNGEKGDCNDVIPAFYSALTYYGFDTYLRYGKSVRDNNNKDRYHTWLSVNMDGTIIDLDPNWYIIFVPLENRNKDIGFSSLNKKYITHHSKK
ncbi:MAG: hypothetical protein ACP5N1_04005 [Candidatus Woesearchaeota archaeon]